MKIFPLCPFKAQRMIYSNPSCFLASVPPAVPELASQDSYPHPQEPSLSAAWGSALGGKLCCLTLVTLIQATPEPRPVQGQLLKAPCLGWVPGSALACGESWVGTTSRLSLNLAGNSLRESAKKFTCTTWATLRRLRVIASRAWAWSMGLPDPFLPPSGLPQAFTDLDQGRG